MKRKDRILLTITVLIVALALSVVWIPTSTFAQDEETVGNAIFPFPTGPHQVGRISRHWTDETREETFTDAEDDLRELMLRIWYPADPEPGAESGPYMQDFVGDTGEDTIGAWLAFAGEDPIVAWFKENIGGWIANSFPDAPLSDAEAKYPVLIFSGGFRSLPEQYTTQIEELASQGYIVVGINHPYTSGVTVFPDGRTVAALPFEFRQPAEIETVLMTQARDIISVLDALEAFNQDDPADQFTGRFNLEQIGVLGHSLGGGSAVIAASMDARIKAIVAEDGSLLPPGRFNVDDISDPMMSITSANTEYRTAGPYYQVEVDGFNHQSFGDDPIWPLPPEVAFANGERTVEIVRTYVLAFFDKHLRGEDVTLLDGPSDDYPEVAIETRNLE